MGRENGADQCAEELSSNGWDLTYQYILQVSGRTIRSGLYRQWCTVWRESNYLGTIGTELNLNTSSLGVGGYRYRSEFRNYSRNPRQEEAQESVGPKIKWRQNGEKEYSLLR